MEPTNENPIDPPIDSIDPPSAVDAELDAPADPLTVAKIQPIVVGKSGTVYRATNLLTELNTRQKNYCRDVLKPAYPTIATLVGKMRAKVSGDDAGFDAMDDGDVFRFLADLELTEVFNALIFDDADLELLAALYLPTDQRTFHVQPFDMTDQRRTSYGRAIDAAVAERMDDLDHLSYIDKFHAFKRFFTWISSYSPASSRGFMDGLLTGAGTTTGTTTR